MASPDHLWVLKRQLEKLHNELVAIHKDKKAIKKAVSSMSKEFKRMAQDHKRLNRAYENQKTDMWFSILSGNTVMAAKAEEKLKRIIEAQAQLQRELPDKYKSWAMTIKAHTDHAKKTADYETKIALKEEEIHRYQPCQSITCKHCKRDFMSIRKAKAVFKEQVTRVLKK